VKRREQNHLGPARLAQNSHNYFGAAAAGFAVVAFCLVLLWRDPLLFWNDDYELSILPVFADVARSWSEGSLPLLSPFSWVCGNLAGEFQYGTFSVFVNAAVVLIRKFPLTFAQQAAALSITHLFALAMGGYLLARGRDLARPLSLLVALVAALNGWIICWGATDWFGALGAFAWLPWAWWAMERALDSRRGKWRFLWPAPFVYLVVTGGFPYTVLMLALVAAWLCAKSLGQTRKLWPIVPLFGGITLGLGLSAPAWLALLDYVHGSARAAQDAAEHFQWRVPFSALPGFLLPKWTVNWADFSSRLMPHTATELACGLVPPVALFVGLVSRSRILVRRIAWDLALLVIALILCLLPTAGVFRWSFRWLPLVHLILALCAAMSLQVLAESGLRWARGWLPATLTFAALLGTYLWISPNCGVPKYNLAQELTEPAPLDPQRLYLSIYPAPESAYRMEKMPQPFGTTIRPGSTSMFGGIRFLNGYSPIRPAGVAREFDSAIHGEISPAKAASLLRDESGAGGLLARLGVDGIIVANEMELVPEPATEWHLVRATKEGRVFHRWESLPRIQSAAVIDSRPNEQFAEASVSGIHEHRNSIAATVSVPSGDRPALLTISRPFFSGYRATLAGRRVPVGSYRGLLPVVELPQGASGSLEIVYRPWWLVWGGGISVLSFAFLLGGSLLAARERRVSQRT
jgi:hypothetical protein